MNPFVSLTDKGERSFHKVLLCAALSQGSWGVTGSKSSTCVTEL